MTRDEVQEAFGAAPDDGGPSDRMADEIDRLRDILAALREPSEAVILAARQHIVSRGVTTMRDTHDAIRAAVAAAEQEVRHDEG